MTNTLKNAVIEQLGHDDETNEELIGMCEDIANHGIDGGFGAFIYYSDTCEFFDNNKDDILNLCREYADDFGQTISEMIAGFGCVQCEANEIELFLAGVDDENETELKNALAWFAGEEVAREIAG